MSRKQPVFNTRLLALLVLLVAAFLVVQQPLVTKNAQAASAQPVVETPIAVIKTIVIRGGKVNKAVASQVSVARAGATLGGQPGMMLYAGDTVATGKDAQLAILFLDEATERDNEILLDAMTKVQLGTLFLESGRILVRVRDKFQVRTSKAQWTVSGTEYELAVQADGANSLRVLKGAVQVEGGTFAPSPMRATSTATTIAPAPVTPHPIPTPASTLTVMRMQELTLPAAGNLRQAEATPQQIEQTLNWSHKLIVAGEPEYSVRSVIPRYKNAAEREAAFRQARLSSTVNDDRSSKEIVADIYIEWGNGAKAEVELREVEVTVKEMGARLTTLGEARRLMGDLTKAEALVKRAIGLESKLMQAYNTLGSVYLDQGKVDLDRKDYAGARASLNKAKAEFAKALELKTQVANSQHHVQQTETRSARAQGVVQANIGEVHMLLGIIARGTNDNADAVRELQTAEEEFSLSAKSDQSYPFALTGLGDVYRELAMTHEILGNQSRADQYLERSQHQYVQALRLHPDLPEANIGLGRAMEAAGRKREALRHYRAAILQRPELAEPYYFYAKALSTVDRLQAARQARIFLKLERPPLKSGERARQAQDVIAGRSTGGKAAVSGSKR